MGSHDGARRTHPIRVRAASVVAAVCLCGCTYNQLDYLYDDLKRFEYQLNAAPVEDGPRLFPGVVTTEDYAGQRYLSDAQRSAIAGRRIAQVFVEQIKAKCWLATYACAVYELKKLGFTCVESPTATECKSARRVTSPTGNPIKGTFKEDQAWTVVVERRADGADIRARLERLGPNF